jgi:hypothetical protein
VRHYPFLTLGLKRNGLREHVSLEERKKYIANQSFDEIALEGEGGLSPAASSDSQIILFAKLQQNVSWKFVPARESSARILEKVLASRKRVHVRAS